MSNQYNLRNPEPGEVAEMQARAKSQREQRIKYNVLSRLLKGERHVDVTVSKEIFEALNKERMDFEELLRLHPNQANDCIKAAKEDREGVEENIYWNRESKAKWGCLGHIPPCCYNARPAEYWKDEKLLKNFFNTFTKFRISTRRV